MDNARIYIVEDSSIIRENLIEALQENAPVEVVGTADDEKSAVAWLRDRSHALRPRHRRHLPEERLRARRPEGDGRDARRAASASSSATTRRPRSASSASSSARPRCSTSRTSSTRCSAGSTASRKAIAELLRRVPEHAEVAADGDEGRAHRQVAARVGLDRRQDADRLAGRLGGREHLRRSLPARSAWPDWPRWPSAGRQVRRADEHAVDAVDRGDLGRRRRGRARLSICTSTQICSLMSSK